MPKDNKNGGKRPTKQEKVNAEDRRYQMLQLTRIGMTERGIAKHFNISRSLVHKEVKRVLNDLAKNNQALADHVRTIQMDRYNSMLERVWPTFWREGDAESLRMVLSILDRINAINGVIPDRPLIDMRTQTIQVGSGIPLMEIAREIANGTFGSGHASTNIDDATEAGDISQGNWIEAVPETD